MNSKDEGIDVFGGEGHYSAYHKKDKQLAKGTKLRKAQFGLKYGPLIPLFFQGKLSLIFSALILGWRTANTAGKGLMVERTGPEICTTHEAFGTFTERL